jgi:hypothetical protein
MGEAPDLPAVIASSAERCAECERAPRPDEDALGHWRVGSDGRGLHVFCPECWEREFADDVPSSSLRR